MKHKASEQLPTTPVRPGVARRVFSGELATVALTTLAPGHAPHPHAHEHEQIVYIVSGRARFVVGDDVVEASAGDLILIPPHVEHFAEAIGDAPCLDLSVFAPRREDYAAEEATS